MTGSRQSRSDWLLLAVFLLVAFGALGTAVLTSSAARAYLNLLFGR
jgi:hypothetical protein